MAYFNTILIALAIVAVALPSTLAKNWTVGDNLGWGYQANYAEWASANTFYVGDNLIFNYAKGSHDVVKVNGTEFQQCIASTGDLTLSSGADVITLATAGIHWYICGFTGHCLGGMKLVVTVETLAPQPPPSAGAPPPPSAATGIAFSKCQAWVVGVFSILMMIIV